IGQKATRFVNETGNFMRATGRHLANKSIGYAHEGRKLAGAGFDRLSDTGIAESVRSALGRLGLRSSDSVGVACEGGCITLSGRCATDDVDVIVATTSSVYGVSSIRNDMDVSERYATGTEAQTSA